MYPRRSKKSHFFQEMFAVRGQLDTPIVCKMNCDVSTVKWDVKSRGVHPIDASLKLHEGRKNCLKFCIM